MATLDDILASYNPSGFVLDNRKAEAGIDLARAQQEHQRQAALHTQQEAEKTRVETEALKRKQRQAEIVQQVYANVYNPQPTYPTSENEHQPGFSSAPVMPAQPAKPPSVRERLRQIEDGLIRGGATVETIREHQKFMADQFKSIGESDLKALEATGKLLMGVRATTDPVAREQAYIGARQNIAKFDPEGAAAMPEQYPGDIAFAGLIGMSGLAEEIARERQINSAADASVANKLHTEQQTKFEAQLQPTKVAEQQEKRDQAERERVARENPNDEAAQLAALTGQQRIDLKRHEQERADQNRRHQESLQAQIRGQNMSDARSRELNALNREDKAEARENRPPTSAENRALGFYVRARDASEAIATMEEEMSKKGLFGQAYYALAPNSVQTDFNQSYRQAQRAFTEARLRKDSGAAIPPQEYLNDEKTYFPRPGDGEKVLEQKRKGREAILNALHLESGRAVKAIGGTPGQAPQASQQPTGGPQLGETRQYQGRTYKFDGKEWVGQ